MKLNRRKCVAVGCALAALTLLASPLVHSQDYPVKPIHIIVPLPPGGSNDVLARVLGQKMSEAFGQPVIVENIAFPQRLVSRMMFTLRPTW